MSSEISHEPMGVLVVNKHAGVTSHDIVSRCRKLFSTRKIGHTGTLDPMATGVLVILVGRAVKASEYLTEHDKTYICTMRLGITTDTQDITGHELACSEDIPDEAEVTEKICRFIGPVTQVPPMYSALKVGGKKLVDLARRGIEIERAPRNVFIRSIETEKIDRENYRMRVECSKGTYIRTLCADIGTALGCGAVMSSLERVASGGYTLDSSVTIDELESMGPEERQGKLLPVETAFAGLTAVSLDEKRAFSVRNGSMLGQCDLGLDLGEDELVTLFEGKSFFALGRSVLKEDGKYIKQDKLFVI